MPHAAFRLADIEVTTLCEGFAPLPLADECPGNDVDWAAERRSYPWAFLDEGHWAWHVHAFHVRTPDGDVLVDTGAGPFGPWEPWAEGSAPEPDPTDPSSVRHVILTHLHADHAGGTVLPDGTPRYPNARYHVHPADWSNFESNPVIRESDGQRYDAREVMQGLADTGVLSLEGDDHEVSPGVRVIHTPGHTPGHRSVLVRAGEGTILLTGDALHVPIQVAHPDWESWHDDDPDEGSRSRAALLAQARQEGWHVGVPHFARPFGTVGAEGWVGGP